MGRGRVGAIRWRGRMRRGIGERKGGEGGRIGKDRGKRGKREREGGD